MKSLVLSIFLILTFCAVSRSQDVAAGSYAANGTMIGITNLTGFSDCSAASATGKIVKIKVGTDYAIVDIDVEQLEEQRVRIPLERVKSEDRPVLFKQLLKKGFKVRVSGYRCTADCAITVFSVDRIYKPKI